MMKVELYRNGEREQEDIREGATCAAQVKKPPCFLNSQVNQPPC